LETEKEGVCAGEKPNNVDIQSEYESRKIENKKNTTVSPMEKFLDSLSKDTMKSYRRGLELFIEFYGKDVETILAERKDDLTPRPNENLVDAKNRASRYENLLEEFHAWMLKPIHAINKKENQAYGINTARTSTLGLLPQGYARQLTPLTLIDFLKAQKWDIRRLSMMLDDVEQLESLASDLKASL